MRRLLWLVPILLWAGGGASLQAAPDERAEYTRINRQWGVEDGLPINSVTGIAQDEAGFLWIATLAGLVRFDGVHFNEVDVYDSSGLSSGRFTSLHRTPDGAFWLSTEQYDLLQFANGKFENIRQAQGLTNDFVVRVTQSPAGWLAFGTRDGVTLITSAGIVPLRHEALSGEILAVHWPTADHLWAATTTQLVRVGSPETDPVYASWPLESPIAILQEQQGRLWAGSSRGLYELGPGGFERRFPDRIRSQVGRLGATPNGALLLESAGALWRLSGGTLRRIGESSSPIGRAPLVVTDSRGEAIIVGGNRLWRSGLEIAQLSREVLAVLSDAEGSVWVGTSGAGLHQLRRSGVRVLGAAQGLPGGNVYPIYREAGGDVWLGVLDHGAIRLGADSSLESFTVLQSIWSIGSVDGEIWLAGGRVCRVNGDACGGTGLEALDTGSPFRMIHQDAGGRVWAGGRFGAMWLRESDAWRPLGPADGWTVTHPVRTALEMTDGTLWFGTNGSGVVRVRGQHADSFDRDWGLGARTVRSLHLLDEDELLVGTEGRGLCRILLDEAEPRPGGCLDSLRGFPSRSVHHMEQDATGRLWWSSNRGIFWQWTKDLRAALDGVLPRLPAGGRIDRSNGLANPEANGGVHPAGFRDERGQLWFPTQDGVVIIAPEEVAAQPPKTVAHIESIRGERSPVAFHDATVRLPAGERNMLVSLSAPSYFNPTQVEFRYRLPNLSSNWFELGTLRQANLTRIGPGRVTVEFAARNAGGAWQSTPTVLVLDVPPYLWERASTQVLAVVLVLLAAVQGVRWRQHKLAERAAALQLLVDERTRELHEIHARRSEFFANVSHELRTPLTLITGPLEDALSANAALSRDELNAMARSSRRLKRMVDQILDLQKIDACEMALSCQAVNLHAFLQSCVEPFAVLGRRIGVGISVQGDSAVRVRIDEAQFEKVIGNLLSNAFKVAPPGSAIEIRSSAANGRARVEVLDRGPGLPPGAEQRVFRRFHQEPGDARRASEGTGIGLALARELVELHGGRVLARNRADGGASFGFELPRLPDGPVAPHPVVAATGHSQQETTVVAAPTPAAPESPPHPERLTLLVVEDNADLRHYIGRVLQPTFQLLFAADGEEGLAAARAHLPDLVVSDIMMPRIDGIGMLRRLREDPETCAIPVLLLTARGAEEHEIEGLETGADDYLVKPFTGTRLMARVRAILAARERLREQLRDERRGRVPPAPVTLLERVRTAVLEHLDDPDFGVEQLALALAMSRSKLFRLLRREHDVAARDLIRELRLAEAARLLGDGAGSVTEVCLAVGFPNLASFSRAFSQAFGVPPSQYRG